MIAPSAVELRPLSIGEIFDRAVTLYVRNFVLFSLMMLTFIIPSAIGQYMLQGPGYIQRYQQSTQVLGNLVTG
jgi:hypothetical protein